MGGFLFIDGYTYSIIIDVYTCCINGAELLFYSIVHNQHPKNLAFMMKSRLILALAIVLFLSSCNRYITTYDAANRHNRCGKFIK